MRLLTPKQQKFCMVYIEKGNASEAYRQSYNTEKMLPATIKRKASELLSNGNITATLEQIQREHRARHDVTIENLTRELDEARLLAVGFLQLSAAVMAIMSKAKLHGLLTEKAMEKALPADILEDEETRQKNLEEIRKKLLGNLYYQSRGINTDGNGERL